MILKSNRFSDQPRELNQLKKGKNMIITLSNEEITELVLTKLKAMNLAGSVEFQAKKGGKVEAIIDTTMQQRVEQSDVNEESAEPVSEDTSAEALLDKFKTPAGVK
jgi:hypothetical protein